MSSHDLFTMSDEELVEFEDQLVRKMEECRPKESPFFLRFQAHQFVQSVKEVNNASR